MPYLSAVSCSAVKNTVQVELTENIVVTRNSLGIHLWDIDVSTLNKAYFEVCECRMTV